MFNLPLASVIFISRVAIQSIERKRVFLQVCRLSHLSVCLSVCMSGKCTVANWIRMPFVVVSGVGRGTGVLDGSGDRRMEKGSFGGKCGTSHCNQWGLCGVVILCHEGCDAALPKLL